MKLKNWLKQNQINQTQFAEIIGVSPPTVSDWVREVTFPSQEHREKILNATEGKVKPRDFKYPAMKITNRIEDLIGCSKTTNWRNKKRGWAVLNYRKRS